MKSVKKIIHSALYITSPLILQKLIWVPTRAILAFFGRLEIRGLENIQGIKANVIFACNHASELDPILVPASLPLFSRYSPIFYASREKGFYKKAGWRQVFYGGILFRIWGSYPVFAGLNDFEKSMHYHITLTGLGVNTCIFPEGKTTPDGNIQPAKGGVAYLAIKTNVPIVPVALKGTYNSSFRGFFSRKQRLVVSYGKPIYPDELKSLVKNNLVEYSVYKDMSNYVMKKVAELM